MFIAHLPSGYLLSVSLLKRLRLASTPAPAIILAGITGAVTPDFDLAYFYLIDHCQTHHHKYFSHWPLSWLLLLGLSALWLRFRHNSSAAAVSLVFFLGGLMHVILDSLVGDIWWLAPFLGRPYALFTVQAVFTPWWLNFILHWSFAAELAICLWAFLLFRRRSQDPPGPGARPHQAFSADPGPGRSA